MVKADLRPFLASLGIVHGRMDGRTPTDADADRQTFGVIDPMRLHQSANKDAPLEVVSVTVNGRVTGG